ncbi:MAG: histidine phosphatase family protein [Planctomycetes bacterium]|nr:histidine phosphatase family protein [Planctomycetota bacterium]MBU4400314.1 histidine phosphatase family protein [Planctomycetota bacterium]MCG2682913.1 histidine phosphatase family protein [Planctomycetales bacterium]
MDLYIVRHAWAAERDDAEWPDDDLRPLTEEGRRRFSRVVEKLVSRGMSPQVIVASPLKRCVETAQLLAAGVDGKPEVVPLDQLRPGSDLDGLLRWTARRAQSHERIAWVGHAPDVGRLTAALIGLPDGLIHFAKGAAAYVRFDAHPTKGGGELRWLVTAKVLGC